MRQVKREKTVKLKYHFESIQSEETPATKGEDVTVHKIDTHEKGSYYEKHGTKHNGGESPSLSKGTVYVSMLKH